MNDIADQAQRLGLQAHRSDWLDRFAQVGLVAYGVMHVVIGWLAVQLAFGDRAGSTSTSGAIHELAAQPFGGVLVWAVGIGMYLLAAWQVVEAMLGHREQVGVHLARKRLASAGKAVVYAVIGTSAVKVALGEGSGGSEKSTDTMTADLMDLPAGQVLVGLVGVGIIVIGAALAFKGVTDRFLRDIDADGQDGATGSAYTWLGRAGYAAKGAALGVVGGLFCYAAVTHEADESGGLDQALAEVLVRPFGPVLLTAMGVGIACFGMFCFAWARHLDR
ncbi:MAG: DUF1206 domain-containing protein [Actinomycetota bacterium]|nr:DUF1206 domain-containing protein [Actinomycetota bacterium]